VDLCSDECKSYLRAQPPLGWKNANRTLPSEERFKAIYLLLQFKNYFTIYVPEKKYFSKRFFLFTFLSISGSYKL
jgi:hypothetical protein